jgi:molybdate transport system substrate-binding protein
MRVRSVVSGAVTLCFLVAVALTQASAAEVKVMSSGGFSAAYRNLAPLFEAQTKNTIVSQWGPSMGNTPQAIPNRMARGEEVDVVILVGDALDGLIKDGKVVASSRVDLARSGIGMAVKAGAPKPDISTVDALKRTLLAAKSIAYSDSASGVYLSTVMFKQLGIYDEVKDKAHMIPADPVGGVVAKGDAEIGFQQISELVPIPGIDIVGPLPKEVQKMTVFSAGIAASSKQPEAAAALIKFLSSPEAAPAIIKSGMEPVTPAK